MTTSYIVTLEEVGDGKFKITGLPEIPTTAQAASASGATGSGLPPANPDGLTFGNFASEDEAFAAAQAATASTQLSYCSTDLPDVAGRFAICRDNAIGFKKYRCQPFIFNDNAEADRDRQNQEDADRIRREGGRG